MDIDPEGFVENAADKLDILDRRVKGDMRRFKKFIESRGDRETGAWRVAVHPRHQSIPAPPGADVEQGGSHAATQTLTSPPVAAVWRAAFVWRAALWVARG